MPQYKIIFRIYQEPAIITANNLEHAGEIADKRYPFWVNIYRLNLPEPLKDTYHNTMLTLEQEANDI